MRRSVPVAPHTSTVNGSGARSNGYPDWWAVARWADAWVDDGYVAFGGSAFLKVPSGDMGPAYDSSAVYRVRAVARLGRRRPVRDAGSATGWAWQVVDG